MPLVQTAQLVADAAARRSGVAALNVITLEHAEAVLDGAERAGSAAILQISENAVRYHHGRPRPLAAACAELAKASAVPISLHLDHVTDTELLHQAADAGFSSVMFDAAALDYQENVAATRRAADWAHSCGLWIEAELGEVGGKNGAHAPGVRTDPGEARDFVAATGVDALAVAIGSSHAMTTRTATLDQQLTSRLADALDVPLVLHGSSGVPDDELVAAIQRGIVKVNVGTALNVALTGAVRDWLRDNDGVDPRGYLSKGREAMAAAVEGLVRLIGGPAN